MKWVLRLCLGLALAARWVQGQEARLPKDQTELRYWLESMVGHHGYSLEEVTAATGLDRAQIEPALSRWGIRPSGHAVPSGSARVKLLPYPGGRHPRTGFLEGAVDPQRETKLSAFLPWDPGSYIVVDVPEAIFTERGLVYLAHRHVPTVWEGQGSVMPRLEWQRRADGCLESERVLPDGVSFGVIARPGTNSVELRWWVRNGSRVPVRQVRAQVCVMLARASGFGGQISTNKLLKPPFCAVANPGKDRWIITAWQGLHRVWQNPPVPCIHSDPALDDVEPGGLKAARGWVWFFEGQDIEGELARLQREYLDPGDSGPPINRVALRQPVPDKLVVLTFDDSVASQYHVVRPLLKQAGFGATFFITEGFGFPTNKSDYLTWEQIRELHADGFEIGNHTQSHMGVSAGTLGRLSQEVAYIAERCEAHGIPKPVSFAYPGNSIHPGGLSVLRQLGIRFARRGAQPEHAYETGRGIAYEPGRDDPLLVPTTGDARPTWTLEQLQAAVGQAKEGRIAVLQFHGVPDREHPWVNTPPERFVEYVAWLKRAGYRCIAMRDLERYVDPGVGSRDPWSVIDWRRTGGLGRQVPD